MKIKQLFCRHSWLWTGTRHVSDSKGYILKSYFQFECEKCGYQFETLNDDYKLKSKKVY